MSCSLSLLNPRSHRRRQVSPGKMCYISCFVTSERQSHPRGVGWFSELSQSQTTWGSTGCWELA